MVSCSKAFKGISDLAALIAVGIRLIKIIQNDGLVRILVQDGRDIMSDSAANSVNTIAVTDINKQFGIGNCSPSQPILR